MKTESNIKPSALAVEPHGEGAEIIFRENIKQELREQEGEQATVYTYDEYRLSVPNRENKRGKNGLNRQRQRNTTRWRRRFAQSATPCLRNQTRVCVSTVWGFKRRRGLRSARGCRF